LPLCLSLVLLLDLISGIAVQRFLLDAYKQVEYNAYMNSNTFGLIATSGKKREGALTK